MIWCKDLVLPVPGEVKKEILHFLAVPDCRSLSSHWWGEVDEMEINSQVKKDYFDSDITKIFYDEDCNEYTMNGRFVDFSLRSKALYIHIGGTLQIQRKRVYDHSDYYSSQRRYYDFSD